MKLKGFFELLQINNNTGKAVTKPVANGILVLTKEDGTSLKINCNAIGAFNADVPEGSYSVSFAVKGNSFPLINIRRGVPFTVSSVTKEDALSNWIGSNAFLELGGEDYDHTSLEGKVNKNTKDITDIGTRIDNLPKPKTDAQVLAVKLAGISFDNAKVTAEDDIKSASGKLQGQIDALPAPPVAYTDDKVRAVKLTGVSFTNKTPIVAGDSLIVANGKLQAQITEQQTTITSLISRIEALETPAG